MHTALKTLESIEKTFPMKTLNFCAIVKQKQSSQNPSNEMKSSFEWKAKAYFRAPWLLFIAMSSSTFLNWDFNVVEEEPRKRRKEKSPHSLKINRDEKRKRLRKKKQFEIFFNWDVSGLLEEFIVVLLSLTLISPLNKRLCESYINAFLSFEQPFRLCVVLFVQ